MTVRLLAVVPVIIGVSFLAFMAVNLLPGNVALLILGSNATPKSIAALTQELHLNRPILERYYDWCVSALHGDLGRSLTNNQSVGRELVSRFPVTLELIGFAFVLALVPAVICASIAAMTRRSILRSIFDGIAMIGLSLPNFIVGLFLILVLSVHLNWLPSIGFTPISNGLVGNLKSLLIPALSLAYVLFAVYYRLLYSEMTSLIRREQFILVAESKGLSWSRMLFAHVLRNASSGLISVIAVNTATLVGATVVLEQLFSIPGVGGLLYNSIFQHDAPVVVGIVVVMALFVVLINLLSDVLNLALNPRLRHAQ
jgi:peptide/nickel transport system permease protein